MNLKIRNFLVFFVIVLIGSMTPVAAVEQTNIQNISNDMGEGDFGMFVMIIF